MLCHGEEARMRELAQHLGRTFAVPTHVPVNGDVVRVEPAARRDVRPTEA